MSRAALLTVFLVLSGALATASPAGADHEYHQDVYVNWEKTTLDVQVLASEDPLVGRAIENAIHAWRTGIQNASSSEALSDVVIRDYIPSVDETPPEGYQPDDVEIVFVPQGFFAWKVIEGPCIATAPVPWGFVEGDQAYVHAAHEFGHCLGLHHVFNHEEEKQPERDLMGSSLGERGCPSNLNLRVLEHVFQGSTSNVTIPSSEYAQVGCSNGEPLFDGGVGSSG